MPDESDQAETVAFLSHGAAYGDAAAPVDRITTHISHIFLVGDRAYKLKRAVRRPYLDFSTVALRRAACERELALNRRMAPQLYEAVAAVTRTSNGGLRLGGTGATVDWLVQMRRFNQDCLFDRMARRGGLSPGLLRALGDTLAAFHAAAEQVPGAGGAAAMERIIRSNDSSFAASPADAFAPSSVARLQLALEAALRDVAPALDARRAQGKVRRCHGDLHLANICLIAGRPVLFDCIEFSDELATTDILYDLAFLLMDLCHRGLTAGANTVFNRYLDRVDESDGLGALPFFMALRAAIRAHVIVSGVSDASRFAEAPTYLDLGLSLLASAPPCLIAIGGLSGVGKSTMSYRLAPQLGRMPGARVVRSDVIRKCLFGLAPEARLGADGYTPEVTARVYARLAQEATTVLAAGQSVILDAVFARPDERAAVQAVAERAEIPFTGLWLEAPQAILEERIGGRAGDASDADISVLRRQLGFDLGQLDWPRLDASGSIDRAAFNARCIISSMGGGSSDPLA